MSDTKLRPEDLTSEERAIVDQYALKLYAEQPGSGGDAEAAYADGLRLILARRALFSPAPSEAEDEFISDGFTSACATIASSPKSAPSEAAKVYYAAPMMGFPCANCGKETLRMDGHVSHRASGDETEYYCDKPAQPEPASPVSDAVQRRILNEPDVVIGAVGGAVKPAAPEMPTNPVESANFNQNRGYSAAPEMPEAVKAAWAELKSASALSRRDGWFDTSTHQDKAANDLKFWWRNSAQPVAAGMTEELERVLKFCDAHNNCKALHPTIFDKEGLRSAIAAVRRQAAQPRARMEKVREFLSWALSRTLPYEKRALGIAALAELDAHEGKGEGRG